MTIKDLKELYEDLQRIKQIKKRINENNDLSLNQKKKEIACYTPKEIQIKGILKKYYNIFNVKAEILARHICDVLEHNISESEVSSAHICPGQYYEKEYFEGVETYYSGYASLRIYISALGNTETISLFHRPTSKDLNHSVDYIMGNYNINCYDFLNNDNIKYSQLLHNACWLAIEENIKIKNKQLQNQVIEKENLINKKIKELQRIKQLYKNKNENITNEQTLVFTDNEIKEIEKEI